MPKVPTTTITVLMITTRNVFERQQPGTQGTHQLDIATTAAANQPQHKQDAEARRKTQDGKQTGLDRRPPVHRRYRH